MSFDKLVIKGARQNNLKNISLSLPHNKVIAVTGVSGSGKSSLAFETLFAEGQWRFMESLSTYVRLFLEKLDRPDVDAIENIRPAIALEQHNPVRGSRSTVGTITELYDLLRLLYSKIGQPHCPSCGARIRRWDPSAIVSELLASQLGQKAMITFETHKRKEHLVREGYLRAMSGGIAVDMDEAPESDPMTVVMDRLVIANEPRLADSVEQAFAEGGGRMGVFIIDGPSLRFSSRNACDACSIELPDPAPMLFSFNHPLGACPNCKGFGNVLNYDEGLMVPNTSLSFKGGAVEPWEKPAARWWKKQALKGLKDAGFPVDTPWESLSQDEKNLVFKGNEEFYGIDEFFEDLEGKRYKLHVRVFLSRYRSAETCPVCKGKRLGPQALAYRIGGFDIADVSERPIGNLKEFFQAPPISDYDAELGREMLRQISLKLGFLSRVGLDYLTLSREGKTLSGGEYQRANISNQLASRLTGTMYVLDEPTVGLHPRDTDRISEIMAELSEFGNTIIVVEHDKEVIERSDWVVELGPGGGHLGGNIVFEGSKEDFLKADTPTARMIRTPVSVDSSSSLDPEGPWLVLKSARGHNLKGVKLAIPLAALSVISGVSGSGKSSLVVETLYPALLKLLRQGGGSPLEFGSIEGYESLSAVKLIDQAPIGKSPRSNPVSYLKIFDSIRKLFADEPEARRNGYGPGFFSFNMPGGRCETCTGEGYQKLEMYFFEDLFIKCEECGGTRYGHEAREIKYKGLSIDQVLELTVDQARGVFDGVPQIMSRLTLLSEIGLGYLKLGQPATTLSGGEAQRLKLSAELGPGRSGNTLYILDEPTVGLHGSDIEDLMGVLGRLVDAGNTVVIIEHNLDVIARARWVVDMGPEGGDGGGEVVFSGTPAKLLRSRKSHTARYLKQAIT